MLILKLLYSILLNLNKLKIYNKKNKGSFLIELILALSIGSIVILSFYMITTFLLNNCNSNNIENEVLLNSRYAMEYIKKNIKNADRIIDTSLIEGLDEKYINNMGFIVMRYNPQTESKNRYNYVFYYLKNNKINRASTNRNIPLYPISTSFSGENLVAEFAESIDETNIDWQKGLISLSFLFGGDDAENIRIETKLKIRCPMDY